MTIGLGSGMGLMMIIVAPFNVLHSNRNLREVDREKEKIEVSDIS